jgi:hypothetical protein
MFGIRLRRRGGERGSGGIEREERMRHESLTGMFAKMLKVVVDT